MGKMKKSEKSEKNEEKKVKKKNKKKMHLWNCLFKTSFFCGKCAQQGCSVLRRGGLRIVEILLERVGEN
jgi:hypothetical protein